MLRAKAVRHDSDPYRLRIELAATTKKDRGVLRKIIDSGISLSSRTDFSVIPKEKYETNVDAVTIHLFLEKR